MSDRGTEPIVDDAYDPVVKAAVMSALLTGQSVTSAAKEYNLPKGTVSGWKRQAFKKAGMVDPQTQKAEIGNLITGYLASNLRALAVQAEVFSDRDWLKKQDANQLAVLHGVMTDKAVRLLEALSAGDQG